MVRLLLLAAVACLSLASAGAKDPHEARVSIQKMLNRVLKKMDAGIAHAKSEYAMETGDAKRAVLGKIAAAEAKMTAQMSPVDQSIVSSRATTKREIDALQNNVDGFNQANLTVSLTRIKTRAMAKRLEVQQEEIRRIHEVHHAIASVDKTFADKSTELMRRVHEGLMRTSAQVADDAAGRRAELGNFQQTRKSVFELTRIWNAQKKREAEKLVRKEEMRKQRELDLAKTNMDLAKAKAEHEVGINGADKAETVALKKEVGAERKALKTMAAAQAKMAADMKKMRKESAKKDEEVAAEKEALAAKKDKIEDEANAVKVEKTKVQAKQAEVDKEKKQVDVKVDAAKAEKSAEAVVAELKL